MFINTIIIAFYQYTHSVLDVSKILLGLYLFNIFKNSFNEMKSKLNSLKFTRDSLQNLRVRLKF